MSRIVRIVTRSGHTASVFPDRDIAPVISLLTARVPGARNEYKLFVAPNLYGDNKISGRLGVDRSRPSHIFHAPQKCPPPPPPCNKRPSLAARFCVCEQDHRYDSAGALLTRGTSIRAIRSIETVSASNRTVTRCF